MSGELVHGVGSRCSRAAKARISRTATRAAVLPPVASSRSRVSDHSTLSAPTAPSACTVLDPPPGSRTHWTHGGGSNKRLFFRGGPTGPTGPTPSRTRPHAREALSAAPKFLPASPARRVQRVQRVQSLFLDSRWTHPVGPERGGWVQTRDGRSPGGRRGLHGTLGRGKRARSPDGPVTLERVARPCDRLEVSGSVFVRDFYDPRKGLDVSDIPAADDYERRSAEAVPREQVAVVVRQGEVIVEAYRAIEVLTPMAGAGEDGKSLGAGLVLPTYMNEPRVDAEKVGA